MFKSLFFIFYILVNLFFLQPEILNVHSKTIIINEPIAEKAKPQKTKTVFIINIKEYFKEEFKKGSTTKDYETKVSLSKIKKRILKDLKKIGIKEKNITIIKDIPEEEKINNQIIKKAKIQINIQDFSIISKIMNIKNKRGITFMHMSKVEDKE